MSCSICPACSLFAAEAMVAVKVMVATRAYRSRIWESRDEQAKEQFQIQGHLVLGHSLILDRQESLEKSIWLVSDGNLRIYVKRFMRTSILNGRQMLQTRVKGGISCTETEKFCTHWASISIPCGKIFLICYLSHDLFNACHCRMDIVFLE